MKSNWRSSLGLMEYLDLCIREEQNRVCFHSFMHPASVADLYRNNIIIIIWSIHLYTHGPGRLLFCLYILMQFLGLQHAHQLWQYASFLPQLPLLCSTTKQNTDHHPHRILGSRNEQQVDPWKTRRSEEVGGRGILLGMIDGRERVRATHTTHAL